MAANPRLREEPSIEAAVLTSDAISFELLLRRQVGFYHQYGKRALDLVLGSVLLLLSLPVIVLLATVVAITSGWPPFYVARRVGKDGKEFGMLKLRTMVKDADQYIEMWQQWNPELAEEYREQYKLQNDPRVTPFGKFLRRTSLDELPQIWNVVAGNMSLVGPRPIVRDEMVHYGANVSVYLANRPGITGKWQVDGRNQIAYPERVFVELDTCVECTLATDLSILLRTVTAVVRSTGS